MKTLSLLIGIALLALTGPVSAELEPDHWVAKQTAEDQKLYAGQDHMLVKTGLVADRKARSVTIYAQATGLGSEEICEFLLTQVDSGKEYETFAVAYALPSDILEAMKFIGAQPGRCADYNALQFWPKGPRVTVTCQWLVDAKAAQMPLEELIYNKQTQTHMKKSGFMFTGSYWYTDTEGKQLLAADTSESRSIISSFNDPGTLFDVPDQAPQGAVYEQFGTHPENPDRGISKGTQLKIIIQPEAQSRLIDLDWQAMAGTPPTYKLLDAQGKDLLAEPTLNAALAKFDELNKQGKDVYVTFTPDEKIELKSVRALAQVIAGLDNNAGIRIDPPKPGVLYYRAYLPDPRWRKKEDRMFHGWDLVITPRPDGTHDLQLVSTDDRKMESGQWTVIDTPYPVTDGPSIAQTLQKIDTRRPREIFVTAPASLPHGQLTALLAPVLKTHRTIHVFLD